MAAKRVLFFGVTGVEKTGDARDPARWGALRRLARWAEDYRERSPRPQVVDFEREYLFNPETGGKVWYSFLGDRQETQRQIWRRAWARFLSDIPFEGDDDLYVSMHGCIVRGHYGVRGSIDASAVAEWTDPAEPGRKLRPDIIITLIDDVYDMWWRTEQRADGAELFGRPTVEQLLFARRAELILADQVAHSVDPPIPHFVISVAHPCETLGNRIYSPDPTVVYLCFPISAPRKMERKDNDTSGRDEVLSFLRVAYERQHRNQRLVMVCPLGIDELPLAQQAKEALRDISPEDDVEDAAPLEFDRESARWPMDSIWKPENSLSPGPPAPDVRIRIPLSQLEKAAGMIHSDVGWRDYRLVEQCGETGCLAAFNPKFRNKPELSRSVRREIRFAAGICPVYVFQDPAHDPGHKFEAEFPEGGTMDREPGELMVVRRNTVADVFDGIETLTERRSR